MTDPYRYSRKNSGTCIQKGPCLLTETLLYPILKLFATVAIRISFRTIRVSVPERLNERGPLLLACNHPNSFLDSVLLNTLFKAPVWSLARGDVFKKPFHRRLLNRLRILPVYRTSEGVENLSENYKTFDDCLALFRKGQVVTIYSEGKCINEWHLRPLKKGTARLALKAWEEGIPLRVLPVGLNYSSFNRFGKNIFIQFGDIITCSSLGEHQSDGHRHQEFNRILREQLNRLVYEIPADDTALWKEKLTVRVHPLLRFILLLPGLAGWLINVPVFLYARHTAISRLKEPGHYDSVVMGILLLVYPLWLLLVTGILFLITKSWLSLLFIPAALAGARAWVLVKKQSKD